jgi:Asp-tRNA(Asn)/Glu-tRNA(Gln) amidotransferase A subunit family amidase
METAREQAMRVRLGELSPLDLVEAALRRTDAVDGKVRAWVEVDRVRALLTARQRYDGSRHGTVVGELIGIPVGIKDIIDVDGLPTRAGAAEFAHYTPSKSATAVERLRHEGANVLGKTATTEFAFVDPAQTRNPWNLECTPGGSSSGSAAAVASGMVPLALGTQTVGSVLRPAAYCGVVGLKGTHGRVSTAGVIPLAPSLDHVGVLAHSVTDAALALAVISGHDPADPRSSTEAALTMSAPIPRKPRIGLAAGFWEERVSEEVRTHTEDLARKLADGGADVCGVSPAFSVQDVVDVSNAILRFEAAVGHRRQFDAHAAEFGPAIRRLIEAGMQTGEDDYRAALQRREALREKMVALLDGVDVLMMPTAPSTAPAGLASTGDSSLCAPASTTGLPSISLPSGVGERGLPLAAQLIGRPFEEAVLLTSAAWVEAVLGFDARPPL